MNKGRIISAESHQAMPDEYTSWRTSIEHRIEQAKLHAVLHVNKDMLSLYYDIGNDILKKQEEKGWGAQVIKQLAADLHHRFPDDRGLSERNLKYMRQFAKEYPNFPIVQVPLAQLRQKEIWQASLAKLADDRGFVQVPLAQITWYHHITLLAKVKDIAQLSLKGFTQPLGIASYEVKQKIADDVFSALPDVDDDEIKDNR